MGNAKNTKSKGRSVMGSKNYRGNDIVMSQLKNRIFWMNAAGATNPSCIQTNIIIALRSQGYKGGLNDLLRAFYHDKFGLSDLNEGLLIFL